MIMSSSKKQQQQKRTNRIVDFAIRTDHKVKIKENKKRDKYLDLARERDDDTNCNWCAWKVTIGLVMRLDELEIIGRAETI